jgi:CHAD domain-containing protein
VTDWISPPGLSDTRRRAALAAALAPRLTVADDGSSEGEVTFYDTFDGLLHRAGLSVVWEDGRLELWAADDGGGARAARAPGRPERPVLAADLPAGELRDALREVIDVRALLAVARVHVRARGLRVLDAERKTVVRVALESPTALLDSPSRRRPLAPRLRLEPVRGYDRDLARVARALERDLGYQAAARTLAHEALEAAGGRPGGVSAKIEVVLSSGERADAAAVAILTRLLEVIEANRDGTIAAIDSEFLHDYRVAVRRSRAVQRELRTVFPPADLKHFRGEFKWLQQITGDARDLDVYLLEFDDYAAMVPERIRADLEPLRAELTVRRRAAHRRMVAALESDRALALPGRWRDFLAALPDRPPHDRPGAAEPIAQLAGSRIATVYRRMVRMGSAIGPESPAEEYHDLRKKGKELRYLLELFGAPLFPDEIVKPMVKILKGLQDVLGRHQDREIQRATLSALRTAVARRAQGADALMAMGVLVGRLEEDERAARGEFADSFAGFAAKAQRRLVKETFS